MKIRIIIPAIVLSALVLAAVSPVFADSPIQRDPSSQQGASVPTTGTRLSMYRGFDLNSCSDSDPNIAAGAINWPANSAFFVRHGWVTFGGHPVTNQSLASFFAPTTNFQLYVDHVEQQSLPDFFSQPGGFHAKLFVTNFPNGLTGTHLIQGWWFADGYDLGGQFGTSVFQLACNLQVTFV